MKIRSHLKLAFALTLVFSHPTALRAADHGHLEAGAVGTNQNDQLIWENGADFLAASGYVKTLDYTNAGRYAGYFQQNITLTVLPRTAANSGPHPQAPGLGSFIRARMSCIEAPPGGEFGFWESGATAPTVSLGAGTVSTNTWALSQNNGSPAADPYGHVHGRRFTATRPGLYKVTFQAIDTSTNGAGGGPLHTPSAELPVWFQAGVNIVKVDPDYDEGHVHVKFGARLGYAWQLEFSDKPGADADWQPAGHPIIGDDVFIQTIHEAEPGTNRFYRVKGTLFVP